MSTLAPNQLLDFTDRVVVVTGGGGGIGAGIARRFGQAGAMVVVNYFRNAAGAESLVNELQSKGGRARAVAGDMTRRDAVQQLADAALETFGRLDVWVNNAGTFPVVGILDMTDAEWQDVIGSNLQTVFLGTQVAARAMAARGGGAIINIASIEGTYVAPNHTHYDAAKAGVLMHTRAAAYELGPRGVRVNAVSPGLIWRPGLDEDWADGVTRFQAACPLQRLGQPDDVADACLFLASPAARWITGVNLTVDGGVTTNKVY